MLVPSDGVPARPRRATVRRADRGRPGRLVPAGLAPGGPFVVAQSARTARRGCWTCSRVRPARPSGPGSPTRSSPATVRRTSCSPRGPQHRELLRVSAQGTVRAETAAFGLPVRQHHALRSPEGSSDRRERRHRSAGGHDRRVRECLPSRPVPGPPRCVPGVDVGRRRRACCWSARRAATQSFAIGCPSEFWLAPVAAGPRGCSSACRTPTRLGGVWRVGDRLVAGTFGPTRGGGGWWEVTEGGVVPLSAAGDPEFEVVDVRGPSSSCSPAQLDGGRAEHRVLVAVDPVRGSSRPLVEGEPAWMTAIGVVPEPCRRGAQTEMGD